MITVGAAAMAVGSEVRMPVDQMLAWTPETSGAPGSGSQSEFCRLLPKIAPLKGSLHVERKRCGKPTCRCMNGGERHGPYWSHRWREGGRQPRRYVKAADLEQVRAGLAEWRRLHPPARSMRDALANLRRLMRHHPQDWRS
jgi:hypothetical protein